MTVERKSRLIAIVLAAATFLVFCPMLGHEFVNYDDPKYVLLNPHVKEGLTNGGVAWAFKSSHAANWHPLTWLSHMLDCELFGLDPRGHHLVSLLLHVANTVLLFLVFRSMTGALWRSAFVAALFGLHPLHVESVAWVAERKDVLSTFFAVLTIGAYARYVASARGRARQRRLWYAAALMLFVLGLSSKPMLVTLPLVLLLLDYWPLGRLGPGSTRAVLEKLPFLFMALASSAVTLWAQAREIYDFEELPVRIRVFNALLSYALYIKNTLWPSRLAIIYPYPTAWNLWLVAALGGLLLVATVVILSRLRKQPYLSVGWLWFLGTLVPVIGLVQVGVQSMADRYMYFPAIGLFVMAAWGAGDLAGGRPKLAPVLRASGIAVLALCMFLTFRQLSVWQDSVTLFEHALQVTQNNAIAHYNLGVALLDERKLDEAREHFAEGSRIMPERAEIQNNLANILMLQGRFAEAVPHYRQALRSKPDHMIAYYNLGLVLEELGRGTEAITHYEKALELQPDFLPARQNLGWALARQGDYSAALAQLREVIRRAPRDAEAHFDLGSLLAQAGRASEAQSEFAIALRLNPDLPAELERKGRKWPH